ncbi:MAG: hypothetical protein HY298_14680 [Verrucomicrobia bacterium]|nr:hypothetical protein [Verrucomicrobiota bacterium]
MKTRYPMRALLGVGLLFGAAHAVLADDTVTFQVDMTRYTNSAGAQAATLVDVRGAFNGWSGGPGATLVNNGANVYTNTFAVVGTNGEKFQYKFTFSTCAGTSWEDNNPPPGAGQPPDEGNNRVLQLIGGAQTLPVVPLYAPSVTTPINLVNANIAFRVDMTEQVQLGNFIPSSGVDTIRVIGAPAAIGGWAGDGVDLTNNPALSGDVSNVYSAVVTICGTPGTPGGEFKFRMNGGWEDTSINDNRNFNFTGADQVLPIYFYGDQPIGPQTNGNITFQVDMTPQVITGGFTNGVSAVRLSGNINNWPGGATGGELLTNNPALSGNASNIYSGTIPLPANTSSTVGNWSRYKFRADGGWESAAIYGVGGNKDRRFFITGGDQVLPLVTYNDASLCDVVLQPTTVTFSLHLTNGTPDRNGVPFDKVNDKVYFNAEFLGWPTWDTNLPEMTNNPVGSDFYEQTFVLSGGTSRRLQFKFGLADPASPSGTHGGVDNETGFQQDHVKYIRTFASTATITAEFGTNFLAILQEPQFGNLVAGPPSGGNIPITWLGGPCVTLQTRSSLTTGSWTDLPATDATVSTNWPNSGSQQFFRLQKRPLP